MNLKNKKRVYKHEKLGKIVKLTKNGSFAATYKTVYTAGKMNFKTARRIYRCCTGKKGSTGGFRWMFQEDYHAFRNKASYKTVQKQLF